jgi:hypothetical protein
LNLVLRLFQEGAPLKATAFDGLCCATNHISFMPKVIEPWTIQERNRWEDYHLKTVAKQERKDRGRIERGRIEPEKGACREDFARSFDVARRRVF